MPAIPDFQIRFRKHVEASQKRDDWARKGLSLNEAGKIEQARTALKKAEYWDFECRKIEADLNPIKRLRIQPRGTR